MKTFLIIFLFTSLFSTPVLAQTVTPSSSEVQKFREVVQQKVKEKLQLLNQEVAPNPKKAYMGTVTAITDTSLTINSQNISHEFLFDDTTVFINLKQSKVKKTDLKVGQEILVLTLKGSNGTFAKRVIWVESKKIINQKVIALGSIADISTTTSVLVLISNNDKNRELQIKVDSNTEILSLDKKTLKFSDLKKGQKIVCIYSNTQNSTYPALRIIKL